MALKGGGRFRGCGDGGLVSLKYNHIYLNLIYEADASSRVHSGAHGGKKFQIN